MQFKLFGHTVITGIHWANAEGKYGLWFVEENNDIVRQHYLFNISLMEATEEGITDGLMVNILKLMISIAWVGKT